MQGLGFRGGSLLIAVWAIPGIVAARITLSDVTILIAAFVIRSFNSSNCVVVVDVFVVVLLVIAVLLMVTMLVTGIAIAITTSDGRVLVWLPLPLGVAGFRG